jgi:hypothetical protein
LLARKAVGIPLSTFRCRHSVVELPLPLPLLLKWQWNPVERAVTAMPEADKVRRLFEWSAAERV